MWLAILAPGMGWTRCRHRGKSRDTGLIGLGSNFPLTLPCGRALGKSFTCLETQFLHLTNR